MVVFGDGAVICGAVTIPTRLVEKVIALAAFLSMKTGNRIRTLLQRGASTLHSITVDIIHVYIFPAALAINGNIGGISSNNKSIRHADRSDCSGRVPTSD
jgi:hypothetical protein